VLLRAIHGTDYASALTDLDPRITYIHDRDVPPFGFEKRSTDQPTIEVHPSAEFYEPALRRKLYHRWLVKAETGALVTITDMTGEGTRQESVSGANSLTDPVLLSVQDELSARFGAYPLPIGANWDLEGITYPPVGLSEILEALEGLGSLVENDILGSTEDPYPTFKELWEDHILLQYRIAGYVLAYIYQVEEARLNG
jgi:hypothetical protein